MRAVVLWSSKAGGRPTDVRVCGASVEAPDGTVEGGCGTNDDEPGGPMSDWLEPGLLQEVRLVLGVSVGPLARWPRMTSRKAVIEKMLSGSSPFWRAERRDGTGLYKRVKDVERAPLQVAGVWWERDSRGAPERSHDKVPSLRSAAPGATCRAEFSARVAGTRLPYIDDVDCGVVAKRGWECNRPHRRLDTARQDLLAECMKRFRVCVFAEERSDERTPREGLGGFPRPRGGSDGRVRRRHSCWHNFMFLDRNGNSTSRKQRSNSFEERGEHVRLLACSSTTT